MHNQAGSFSVNAKGSADAFAEAASAAAITPRVATLTQGERTIRGLEDSREVARWAYGAKVGEMSKIFNVGDDYVIAILTGHRRRRVCFAAEGLGAGPFAGDA